MQALFMDENRNLKSQRSALEKDKTTFHAFLLHLLDASAVYYAHLEKAAAGTEFMSVFELNNHKGSARMCAHR